MKNISVLLPEGLISARIVMIQKLYSHLLIPVLLLMLGACASHPTPGMTQMKQGESTYGYTLAVENVFPYVWYRTALTDMTNIGVRVGLPLYGTGIDVSRTLYSREKRWDVLNIAYSLNPNKNIDFTYYKFYEGKEKEGLDPSVFWWGVRGMYIANGISDRTSTRMGILIGTKRWQRMSIELGYYHDFAAMPLSSLFDFNWDHDSPANKAQFGDFPHVDPASGMPSEHSRMTGFSLQLMFHLKSSKIPGTEEVSSP